MRVDFEQSGGYANISFAFRADLDELPQATAEELRRLIETSGILEAVPASAPGPQAGLSYRLRVSDGPRVAAWQGTDATLAAALAPLVDRLSELAVEAKKRGG